ncbi:MAG: hypothetical protein AAFY20_02400 [Cyanobacteria bacterium J06639_14]
MTYQLETIHPNHPHHLECPRCKHHTVVLQGESRYVCLNCGWWRDIDGWNIPIFPILMVLVIFLVILLG